MALLTITFKDPDGVSDALQAAGLDQNHLSKPVLIGLHKFVEWSEYTTIEIDTTAGTARVLPVDTEGI